MSFTYKTAGKLVVSTILLLLSILYISHQQTSAASTDKVYMMYYPFWTDMSVDEFSRNVNSVTHINYSFLNLDADGNCKFDDGDSTSLNGAGVGAYPQTGRVNQLLALRDDYPHIKLIFSVGGWTWSDHFSNVAKDPAKRATMVSTCIDIMNTHNFDGIDIDWEYPAVQGEAGNSVDPQNDSDNYILMLSELRAEMTAEQELSIATSASSNAYTAIDAAGIAAQLDHVNIMTYDFSGAWEPVTGHHTNWSGSNVVNSGLDAAQGYMAEGVPANKIVVGTAFYGRSWSNVSEGGTNGYQQSGQGASEYMYDAIQGLLNDPSAGFVRYWDAEAQTPYAYSPTYQGGTFITYDDAESIAVKAQAVHDLGLAGMINWDVAGNRNDQALYEPIDSILLANNSTNPTPVATTSVPSTPTSVPSTPTSSTPTPVMPTATTPANGSSCDSPAWDASTAYVGDAGLGDGLGEIVSHNGAEWRALWWTQSDEPGTDTMWEELGSCSNATELPPTQIPATEIPATATPIPPTQIPTTTMPTATMVSSDSGKTVNCDDIWNLVDSILIKRYNVFLIPDTMDCATITTSNPAVYMPECDVNNDGTCGLIDAVIIQQCNAFITNPFCADLQ